MKYSKKVAYSLSLILCTIGFVYAGNLPEERQVSIAYNVKVYDPEGLPQGVLLQGATVTINPNYVKDGRQGVVFSNGNIAYVDPRAILEVDKMPIDNSNIGQVPSAPISLGVSVSSKDLDQRSLAGINVTALPDVETRYPLYKQDTTIGDKGGKSLEGPVNSNFVGKGEILDPNTKDLGNGITEMKVLTPDGQTSALIRASTDQQGNTTYQRFLVDDKGGISSVSSVLMVDKYGKEVASDKIENGVVDGTRGSDFNQKPDPKPDQNFIDSNTNIAGNTSDNYREPCGFFCSLFGLQKSPDTPNAPVETLRPGYKQDTTIGDKGGSTIEDPHAVGGYSVPTVPHGSNQPDQFSQANTNIVGKSIPEDQINNTFVGKGEHIDSTKTVDLPDRTQVTIVGQNGNPSAIVFVSKDEQGNTVLQRYYIDDNGSMSSVSQAVVFDPSGNNIASDKINNPDSYGVNGYNYTSSNIPAGSEKPDQFDNANAPPSGSTGVWDDVKDFFYSLGSGGSKVDAPSQTSQKDCYFCFFRTDDPNKMAPIETLRPGYNQDTTIGDKGGSAIPGSQGNGMTAPSNGASLLGQPDPGKPDGADLGGYNTSQPNPEQQGGGNGMTAPANGTNMLGQPSSNIPAGSEKPDQFDNANNNYGSPAPDESVDISGYTAPDPYTYTSGGGGNNDGGQAFGGYTSFYGGIGSIVPGICRSSNAQSFLGSIGIKTGCPKN